MQTDLILEKLVKDRIRICVLGQVVFFQKMMSFTFTINRKPD